MKVGIGRQLRHVVPRRGRAPSAAGAVLLVVAGGLYVGMQRAIADARAECACPGEDDLGLGIIALTWIAPMMLVGGTSLMSLIVALIPRQR